MNARGKLRFWYCKFCKNV